MGLVSSMDCGNTCVLPCSPVYVTPDPIRGDDNVLVLCEVFYPDGTPHETNTRAKLEALIDDKVRAEAPLYGFEQVCLSCNLSPSPSPSPSPAVQQTPYNCLSAEGPNACLPVCSASLLAFMSVRDTGCGGISTTRWTTFPD